MTFFVDANVVLYAASDGEQHDDCAEVMRAIAGGADGRTSVAVLEEVWHIERSGRLAGLDGATERAYRLFAPLLPVSDEAFARALGWTHKGSAPQTVSTSAPAWSTASTRS